MREPTTMYLDPLDAVWLTAAHRIGFRVERSREAYASTDGEGLMVIGTPDTLDPDDCLAQMILHELCHSLVEGAASLALPDFGLDNETRQDDVREHACLRLQASLTDPHGLRHVLAPTTDFRDYYDQLPNDPLAGQTPEAIEARRGAGRAKGPPWAPHIDVALTATAQILNAAKSAGAVDPLASEPPIWDATKPRFPKG